MPATEYFGWMKYFEMRPVGWREDYRSSILTQTTYQGKAKLDMDKFYPSLNIVKNNYKDDNRHHPFVELVKSRLREQGHNVIED